MWTASTIMTRRPSVDDPTSTSADAFTTPASLASPADSGMEDVAEAMGVGDTSAVRTINRGAFSTVTLVLDRMSGRYCALKATRKADLLRTGAALSVVREKQALLALQPHPFVVQLFWTAQDANHLYMLLQLGLGGDLRGVLLRRRQSSYGPALAGEQVRFYASVLVLVLEHLHGKGFVYRDLKPDNVLLDERGYPLLCDFGTAVHVGSSGRALTITGTWEYAAPEQLEGRGATMAADWWALGVLCFECLTDGLPFPFAEDDATQSPAHVLECIARRVHTYKMAEQLSAAAADFVGGMLQTDERRRWEAALGARSAAFFAGVPWDAVPSRTATAPYVPDLRGPADTSNFSYADLRTDGDGDGDGEDLEDRGARHHAAWEAF